MLNFKIILLNIEWYLNILQYIISRIKTPTNTFSHNLSAKKNDWTETTSYFLFQCFFALAPLTLLSFFWVTRLLLLSFSLPQLLFQYTSVDLSVLVLPTTSNVEGCRLYHFKLNSKIKHLNCTISSFLLFICSTSPNSDNPKLERSLTV